MFSPIMGDGPPLGKHVHVSGVPDEQHSMTDCVYSCAIRVSKWSFMTTCP